MYIVVYFINFYDSGLATLDELQYILLDKSLEGGQGNRLARKTTTTTSDERDQVAISARCLDNRKFSADLEGTALPAVTGLWVAPETFSFWRGDLQFFFH